MCICGHSSHGVCKRGVVLSPVYPFSIPRSARNEGYSEAKMLTWFHLRFCSPMEGFQIFWGYFIWIYWKSGIYYRHYRITCTLKKSLYSPWRVSYPLVWIYSSYAELWFWVRFLIPSCIFILFCICFAMYQGCK